QRRDGPFVGGVHAAPDRSHAGVGEAGRGAPRRGLVDVHAHDGVAVAGEPPGDRAAEAAARAGDQGRPRRHAGSTRASCVPAVTTSPTATAIPLTVPSTAARTGFSIFIASTTNSTCPAVTRSPSATLTAITVPCFGLSTAPDPAGWPPPRRPRRPPPAARRRAAVGVGAAVGRSTPK